jgi:hypothetical protein
MLKMFTLFGITSLCVLGPFYLWSQWKLANVADDDEFDEGTLKEYLDESTSILNVVLLYFFSIYCIFTLFRIKTHVKAQMVITYHNSKGIYEFEKLNTQCVHVRGMFPEDRRGDLVKEELEAFLEYNGGGKILSLKIIPDFVEIVELENEMKTLNDARRLYAANEPAVRRMCFPSQYRRE